jgi:peptidoglycan/LPS O-acetylase OafA/YrhL
MGLLVIGGTVLIGLTLASARAALSPAIGWGLFGATYAVLLLGMSLLPLSAVVNRATTYLGQVSYSLYLAHPIVIALLIPVFRRIQASVPQTDLAYLACAALTLGIAIPLAQLGYRFIEVPGIRAGHRLLAYINARRTTAMERADQRE